MRVSELRNRLLRWLLLSFFFLLPLLALGGRADLPLLWAWAGVFSAVALVMILTVDPELARERQRPGPGSVDLWRRPVFGGLFLAHAVMGFLDVGRFHWSDSVPYALRLAGLVGFAAGMGLFAWGMAVNRFFSTAIRIQKERGHTVVSAGPYGVVRHPGYLGLSLAVPASGLAIGSWWAFGIGAAAALVILHRASVEDRYLLENLPGYPDYARRVRFRLLPGFW